MSTVVVVGSGGREHALAWKLAQSPRVSRLIVAPGNSGMNSKWEKWSFSYSEQSLDLRKRSFEEFAQRCLKEKVDLVVVGPDNPLADGIVDVLNHHKISVFGPQAAAAQIEASKAFSKEVMLSVDVPTAKHWVASSEEEARKILKSVPWHPVNSGWVVKADGLALGKGVRVCSTLEEALEAAHELMQVSGKLVIEERLSGEEISWMALCDGEHCALLEPARDYKRLLDRDEGPNTGGMGAFSPVPGIPSGFATEIYEKVFISVLREMKKRNAEFRGLLYAGLMADFKKNKYWVLEFNSRFGDPEAQVLLPRIEGDLYPWLEASARGDMRELVSQSRTRGYPQVPFKKEEAVFVVAAAKGYPEKPESGKRIESKSESVFFAGVRSTENSGSSTRDATGELFTSGGRVLGALGLGKNLETARQEAYSQLKNVRFEGMQYRSDIGKLADT